jgi:hypothetical protein
MKILEQPNRDWVRPTRLELMLFHALTGVEGKPHTVDDWNTSIDRGVKRWEAALDHTPAVATMCITLLHDMLIDESTYEDPDVKVVRADQDENADSNKQ